MARPVVSAIANRMYDEGLYPLAFDDALNNWALLHFCEAYIGALQEVENVSRDNPAIDAPGWSAVLDVDRAPYQGLPWLGQFVGLTTPAILTGETQAAHDARVRAYIKATGGFKRGTVASVVGAVQQFLTGTKSVILIERDSSAYHFDIRSRMGQTPVEEWPATNINPNGGFETNLTGWNIGSDITAVRDTSIAKFGTASMKSTINALTSHQTIFGPDCTISGSTAGRKFSASIWVYAIGSTVGKPYRLGLREEGGATGPQDFDPGSVPILINGWNRLTVTKTIIQNDRTKVYLYFLNGTSPAIGDIVYLDGAQVEENTQATPYIETNGAPASRISGMGNIRKAINAQKPAGLQYVYTAIPDWTYDDLDAYRTTYNALEAVFSTYDQMEVHP